MTSSLRTHPRDPRVRISDDLADLSQLVPGETKLVEIENSVDEALIALAHDMSLEDKITLKRAWDAATPVSFDPVMNEPHLNDYNNGKVADKIKQLTPDPLFADIMDLCRLHRRAYGSDLLNVTVLGSQHQARATYGFHFDTPSSAQREQVRLGRIYKGSASEWYPVAEGHDLTREKYALLREASEGNIYKDLSNDFPWVDRVENPVIGQGTTAAWRGLSQSFNDPNTGLFHRRVQNMHDRLAIVVDGWITPSPPISGTP